MLANSFILLIFITILTVSLRLCSGEEDNDDVPLVRVKQGIIKGIKEKAINDKQFYSYLGIPFAEPPTGSLRFKDPVPSKPWKGILSGTKMAAPCPQISFFDMLPKDIPTTTLLGNEDCLYLNVFTHVPNQSGTKHPVLVFIHGGAFIIGGAQEYQPYVLMTKEIVLVVIQYRLGVFGFLSTEDTVMPGNMGLKDQQLALKWVKENIEVFGGDPDTITIFGESAGAGSVHYQVLSPGSKGLFKRAIMQSGTALCPWASNVNHRKFAVETGAQFNCSIDFGTETYLECMQNVNPLYLIIAGTAKAKWGMAPYYELPRVDGKFISNAPEILMKEGKYNKVDIIAGITRDEGALELLMDHVDPSRRDTLNTNFEELGPYTLAMQEEENPLEIVKKIYQFYLHRDDTTIRETDREELVQMHSDVFFRTCFDTTANFFARDKNINLYLYQLDHFGQVSLMSMLQGFNRSGIISHGDDLPYLFYGGMLFQQLMENEEDLRLREIILSSWIQFAKTGNPNLANFDFEWERATEKRFKHLSLTPHPRMKEDNFVLNRKFWSSLNTRQNRNIGRVDGILRDKERSEL